MFIYVLIDFNSVVEFRVRRKHKHVNGLDNGTFSPSSIVCGSGLFIVSGKNKLAIPPSVSKHPIMIKGNTNILLPYFDKIPEIFKQMKSAKFEKISIKF